jgi:hypothetical protein
MNGYIFVRLMGGLGNQLFQYAAGLLQAISTNGKLYLLKPVENIHDTQDYRTTIFTLGEAYDGNTPPHVSLYQDNGFSSWNPLDYNAPIVLLYGYFQNYRCLTPILDEFKNHINHNLFNERSIMKNKYNIVSNCGFIHVRRGDYLKLNIELKDNSYYANALQQFKHITTWFIFSDDIEWCKKYELFNNLKTVYVEESNPILCLALMCEIKDGAIIANSTFSWMGAYLGCGTNKVVYPKIWIGSDTPDLFPDGWVGL